MSYVFSSSLSVFSECRKSWKYWRLSFFLVIVTSMNVCAAFVFYLRNLNIWVFSLCKYSFIIMCFWWQFELVEVVVTALKNLLQSHPTLSDEVPSLGYIPRLCALLQAHSPPRTASAILRILHQLSTSDVSIKKFQPNKVLFSILMWTCSQSWNNKLILEIILNKKFPFPTLNISIFFTHTHTHICIYLHTISFVLVFTGQQNIYKIWMVKIN